MKESYGGVSMWQFWLIAAGVFFIGEAITVGFLIFWLGVASLITMCVSFFTSNIIVQMTVFVISSVLLIIFTKPLVKRFVDKKTVVTNSYSIIGKNAIVTKEINTTLGNGQIKIGGEVWSAKTEDETVIPKGTEVTILSIDGVKAVVSPIKVPSTSTN